MRAAHCRQCPYGSPAAGCAREGDLSQCGPCLHTERVRQREAERGGETQREAERGRERQREAEREAEKEAEKEAERGRERARTELKALLLAVDLPGSGLSRQCSGVEVRRGARHHAYTQRE